MKDGRTSRPSVPRLLVVLTPFIAACSSSTHTSSSATDATVDAASDTAIDAAIDAASGTTFDAAFDAAIDTAIDTAVGDSIAVEDVPTDTTADASRADASSMDSLPADAIVPDTPSSVDGGDAAPPSDASAGPMPLSYMIGIKTNSVPDGPATVEGWLGRPIDVAGTTITTTAYIGSGKPYTTAAGDHPLLEVSFPLLSIFGESNELNDMAAAASGAYDATYTAMAEALAAAKNPLLSVRIGWEFNGNWYAWSVGSAGVNPSYANYIAAFQRAAAIVKAKNPHALIQWCIAWGQPDPTPYWPGTYDATTNPGGVDVVSMDFYQANISHYNDGGKISTWAMAQSGTGAIGTGPIVLDWMVAFAQAHDVKVALSEYGAGDTTSAGVGTGPGLDDGTWTAASIAWMNGLPPGLFLWANWSDDEPADDIVTAGANPSEQAAWVSAWKGTRFGGGWWTGTPAP